MPAMLIVALLLFPLIMNLHISRVEAALLITVFIALIAVTVHFARRENSKTKISIAADAAHETSKVKSSKSIQANVVFIILGLAGLAIGAKMSVSGAVFLGIKIGLSEAVIGLTIIALGTSLPELVTCLVASIKGQDDISIGNLVGSNIFNTLLVTGAAGLIHPFDISERIAGVEYLIMIAVSATFIIMALLYRRVIGRVGGVILLAVYIAYIAYLFTSNK
jgi:cation:H+ antiporter